MKGMDIEEAIELIKGPKDKPVKLVLGRTNEKGKRKKIKISLVRDTFKIPNNESLNQMKIREWFNREFQSDLELMLQQNEKTIEIKSDHSWPRYRDAPTTVTQIKTYKRSAP